MQPFSLHIANVFPLCAPATGSIFLVPIQVEPIDGAPLTRSILGELCYLLERHHGILSTPWGRPRICALQIEGITGWPSALEHTTGRYRLAVNAPITASLADPAYHGVLRILAARGLRQTLVYRERRLWYRPGDGYFPHQLTPLARGFICHGITMQILFTRSNVLSVALDPTFCPIGPALGELTGERLREFLERNPYSPVGSGHGLRRRNFVVWDKERLRRVYVAQRRLPEDGHILVSSGRGTPPWSVPLEQLYPILAPPEMDAFLGARWRQVVGGQPTQRQTKVLAFIRDQLADVVCLGGQVGMTPCVRGVNPPGGSGSSKMQRSAPGAGCPPADPPELERLPWPVLSAGPAAAGVKVPPNPVEHRLRALAEHGPLEVPDSWRRLDIVAVRGREKAAEELQVACQELLAEWRVPQIQVHLCPVVYERGTASHPLQPVVEYYRQSSERPALLMVFKDRDEGEGDSLYQMIHRDLGNNFGIPTKVVQGGGRDLRAYVINCMGSLLARGGAVLWGLSRPALTHDLCIGVDIGGRDRSVGHGDDRLTAMAMAGSARPGFWVLRDPPALTGEVLGEPELEAVVLGAARALKGRYRRHWLYLRDGGIPDEEHEALVRVARRAREEKLLGDDQSFVAVEVHKSHALRLFRETPDEQWQQPETGMLWRLPGFDAVLTATGGAWNTPSSADPLRCISRTLLATADGKSTRGKVPMDVWLLTHLNYSAPRNCCKLPIVLHGAQKISEDLANGLTPRFLPF